jgi:hypothetical protein
MRIVISGLGSLFGSQSSSRPLYEVRRPLYRGFIKSVALASGLDIAASEQERPVNTEREPTLARST